MHDFCNHTDGMFCFIGRRCTKVLPVASAAYQDNLPTHYTEDYHQTRVRNYVLLHFKTIVLTINLTFQSIIMILNILLF